MPLILLIRLPLFEEVPRRTIPRLQRREASPSLLAIPGPSAGRCLGHYNSPLLQHIAVARCLRDHGNPSLRTPTYEDRSWCSPAGEGVSFTCTKSNQIGKNYACFPSIGITTERLANQTDATSCFILPLPTAGLTWLRRTAQDRGGKIASLTDRLLLTAPQRFFRGGIPTLRTISPGRGRLGTASRSRLPLNRSLTAVLSNSRPPAARDTLLPIMRRSLQASRQDSDKKSGRERAQDRPFQTRGKGQLSSWRR